MHIADFSVGMLGANGVEKVLELQLTKKEMSDLQASAKKYKGVLKEIGY